jgi:hypothetical protein
VYVRLSALRVRYLISETGIIWLQKGNPPKTGSLLYSLRCNPSTYLWTQKPILVILSVSSSAFRFCRPPSCSRSTTFFHHSLVSLPSTVPMHKFVLMRDLTPCLLYFFSSNPSRSHHYIRPGLSPKGHKFVQTRLKQISAPLLPLRSCYRVIQL